MVLDLRYGIVAMLEREYAGNVIVFSLFSAKDSAAKLGVQMSPRNNTQELCKPTIQNIARY